MPIIPVIKVVNIINANNLRSRAAFIISLKKKIITERSVPKCNTTDKAISSPERPKILWAITRCPELDTGKNSVKP
jgi:hypothetical protein